MRTLIPAVALLVLAACNTTVSKEEMSSVDYGPAPTRWKPPSW